MFCHDLQGQQSFSQVDEYQIGVSNQRAAKPLDRAAAYQKFTGSISCSHTVEEPQINYVNDAIAHTLLY